MAVQPGQVRGYAYPGVAGVDPSGINVRLFTPGWVTEVASTWCDPQGEYLFQGIDPGNYVLLPQVPNGGYLETWRAVEVLEFKTVIPPAVHLVPGDVNQSGQIGLEDLAAIAQRLGARQGYPNYWIACDLNRDGVINVLDLTLCGRYFGQKHPSPWPGDIRFGSPIHKELAVAEIWQKLQFCREYLLQLYRQGTNGAVFSEYPGMPLNIDVQKKADPYWVDVLSPRFSGMYHSNIPVPLWAWFWLSLPEDIRTRLETETILETEFSFEADFLPENPVLNENFYEPLLEVRREHRPDGTQRLTIIFKEFRDSTKKAVIYLGDAPLGTVSDQTPPNIEIADMWSTPWAVLGSARYTIRHGVMGARNLFKALGDTVKSTKLKAFAEAHGYLFDLYDPIWNVTWQPGGAPDIYFPWTEGCWHDSSLGQDYEANAHYHGRNPYGYAYESKINWSEQFVNLKGSVFVWVDSLRFQPYIIALTALNALLHTGNPDYEYDNPAFLSVVPYTWQRVWLPGTRKTTPRQECWRLLNTWWNGYGFHNRTGVWGMDFVAKAEWAGLMYTSGVIAILATLLGYKYGDAYIKRWADTIFAESLFHTQVGVEWDEGQGEYIRTGEFENVGATLEGDPTYHEVMRRNNFAGSALIAWQPGKWKTFASTKGGGGVAWPEQFTHRDLFYNMPPEDPVIIPTNAEANFVWFQALRTNLYYRHQVVFGTDPTTIPGYGG